MIRGTEGYTEQAPELIRRYEAIGFAERHRAVLHLLPRKSSTVLDIGAGTGVDAAWLASQGHRVLAVEPTLELRAYGIERHASPLIEWMDDCLPRLERVLRRRQAFDRVLLTAVWMHLAEHDRALAMPVVVSLLASRGMLIMSIRHGPVPAGRVMFEVTPEETVALASKHGLEPVFNARSASTQAANREAGVTWSHLAFARPSSDQPVTTVRAP